MPAWDVALPKVIDPTLVPKVASVPTASAVRFRVDETEVPTLRVVTPARLTAPRLKVEPAATVRGPESEPPPARAKVPRPVTLRLPLETGPLKV